jgi:polar amino acid transport system substrate-binding protein
MKFIKKFACGIAIAAGAIAATLPSIGQAATGDSILNQVLSRGTLRIAIIGGLPPYSRMSANGTPEGYDIDIGKKIAEALKVKPEFIVTDIPGRVSSLQTRKVDLTIATFTRTVERSTTIAFSDPYVVSSIQLLVKADRTEFKKTQDLNKPGIRIAMTRGGTAEKAVPLVAPKAELVRFNSTADEIAALRSGQVDAMSEDNLFNAQAQKESPGQFRPMPELLNRAEIAIGMPAGDADWTRVINLWIEQFNASGENDKLFEKWFGYSKPSIQAKY